MRRQNESFQSGRVAWKDSRTKHSEKRAQMDQRKGQLKGRLTTREEFSGGTFVRKQPKAREILAM
jgi:hypothetical protein